MRPSRGMGDINPKKVPKTGTRKAGKQFVAQPKSVDKKVKAYRA